MEGEDLHIRLQIWESTLQQIGNETTQELLVSCSSRGLVWLVDRTLDLRRSIVSWVNEIKHPRQQHRLGFESSLVVRVGENEEYILQNGNEELLEESIRSSRIGFGNVGDQLEAHVETSIFDFAVVMLTSPHARIDNKLELSIVKLEESYEDISRINKLSV